MATKGQKHLNSFANDEHDGVEYRKRVATYVDGTTLSYEDTNFVSADSPAVMNVSSDLIALTGATNAYGHKGQVINDGPGSFTVEVSADGTNYGGAHTLNWGDILSLDDLKVSKIRITRVDDSSYRILVA